MLPSRFAECYRDGTVGVVGVVGNRDAAPDSVPSIVIAAEQDNMLARLAAAGRDLELRVELRTRYFDDNRRTTYNVIAEIPGRDPQLREEVVLIGAHLDSWHTATGATDNADGVAAVMEAMRLLMAVGARRGERFAWRSGAARSRGCSARAPTWHNTSRTRLPTTDWRCT